MTDDSGAAFEKFCSTGRIGRRNALPDILDEKHANVGTCEISDSLTKLKCKEDNESSKSDTACAKGAEGCEDKDNDTKNDKSQGCS